MREVTLFLAMSLDGCIAAPDGSVDWLAGHDPDGGDGGSYDRFIAGVDTVLMGWRTYHQVVTRLAPGRWPYRGLAAYVVTHRTLTDAPADVQAAQDPCALVRRLKTQPGAGIWVCGGADLARQLMEQDLIDVYDISVIPVLLGDGIRLFDGGLPTCSLRLTAVQSANGIAELIYRRYRNP